MSCAFDKEKLTAFYDGELDAAGKSEVERHISSCSECLRDLGEIKSASLLVRELPRPRAPRSIAEGVSREIAATGRVHSFSRKRNLLLWATAAAAGLFVAANVIFLAGDPAASPGRDDASAIGYLQAPAPEKKGPGERADGPARRPAPEPPAEGKARDSADLATKAEPAKDPRDGARQLEEARKADALPAVAKVEEKANAEKAPAPPRPEAPKPSAPAAPPAAATPPPAPVAEPRNRAESRSLAQERGEELQKQRAQELGAEQAASAVLNVRVAASQAAKVRAQVEEIIARRYAPAPGAEAGARRLVEPEAAKKLADVRRESLAGPITLELTPAQAEELRREIEKATGTPLVLATSSDAFGRLRGAAAPGGKSGAPETADRAAAPQAGGFAKAPPPAPPSDELRRKSPDPGAALKDQKAATGQQAPAQKNELEEKEKDKDKNAKETESAHLRQGETRIRIVINFLEVPVAEKK